MEKSFTSMEDTADTVLSAKKFAQEKHKNQKRKDGITPFSDHLEGVVNRLKNLGITDKNILCAAWLHDIIENTNVTFNEINERFGREIAVIVLSLSKDKNILKKDLETVYANQLKDSSFQSKIIKLCDISANLKDIVNAPISKTQRNKQIKKMLHYLRVIKNDISENKSQYPKIQEIIDGINTICIKFNQNPILI
ncbi:MAG: HD domain-containing protein [Nitrosarchaeum sp.]|nr:HD domain-containing protein [Nitrosarchaeum sp.]